MASPLPYELWERVARLAITCFSGTKLFKPPVGNFKCVQGFAEASNAFGELVQILKDEVLTISWDDFRNLKADDNAWCRVRHLEVGSKSDVDVINAELCKPLFDGLSRFSTITTLSLPATPYSPLQLLEYLHQLPLRRTLQCLDIRGSLSSAREKKVFPQESVVLHFPHLLRLRVSTEPWVYVELIDMDLVGRIASFLGGCRSLELISFHAAFDDLGTWAQLYATHRATLEHLQPSEGYERDIADCPLCYGVYDHASVIQKEISATRILAEKLPALTEVRWASLWVRSPKEESGQRGTTISREDGAVMLSRDKERDT